MQVEVVSAVHVPRSKPLASGPHCGCLPSAGQTVSALLLQVPTALHPMGAHSASVSQGCTALVIVMSHALKKHGPVVGGFAAGLAGHCADDVHVLGTPAAVRGKYWRPTPMPADAGSPTNAFIAETTEVHFEALAAMRSSIEPDESSMK